MIKVIIVDDEQLFRDYLLSVIKWEDYGFEIVSSSKNALEALEFAENNVVDLALLDINMPIINGIELAKRLKEIYPLLKIVFITGYDSFDYTKKAIKLKVSDYILKPFDEDELLEVLERVKSEMLAENKKVLEMREIVLNDFISNMVIDEYETWKEHLMAFGIEFIKPFYQVVIIEIDYNYIEQCEIGRDGIKRIEHAWVEYIQKTAYEITFIDTEKRIISIWKWKMYFLQGIRV